MIGDGRIRTTRGRVLHTGGKITTKGVCCDCPCAGDVINATVTVSNAPDGCALLDYSFNIFIAFINYVHALGGPDLAVWWIENTYGESLVIYYHKPTKKYYAMLASGGYTTMFGGSDVTFNGQGLKDITDQVTCTDGTLSGTFDLYGQDTCAGATAHVTITHPDLSACPCFHDRPRLTVTVNTSGNYTEYQTCQSLAGEYHCGLFMYGAYDTTCSPMWYFYLLNYPLYGAQIDGPYVALSYDSNSDTWSADLVTPAGPTAFSGNNLSVSCSNGQLSGTFTLNAVGFYCTGTAVITIGRP